MVGSKLNIDSGSKYLADILKEGFVLCQKNYGYLLLE